jgi:hypothetical protein
VRVWISRFDRLLRFGELAGAGVGVRLLSWIFAAVQQLVFDGLFPPSHAGSK